MRMSIEKTPVPARYLPHCPMGNFVLQKKLMPEFKALEATLLENYFQPRQHVLVQFPEDKKYIMDYLGKCHARRRRANIQDNSVHVCTLI